MCSVDMWLHIKSVCKKLVSIRGFTTIDNLMKFIQRCGQIILPSSPLLTLPTRKGLGTKLGASQIWFARLVLTPYRTLYSLRNFSKSSVKYC